MSFKSLMYTLIGDTGSMNSLPLPKFNAANEPYTDRELIELESKIGARLFGPVPAGHRREFFCVDDTSWIWYEEWRQDGKLQKTTVRYEVQPAGILKIQSGARYSYLEGAELENFIAAVKAYHHAVLTGLYRMQPAAA